MRRFIILWNWKKNNPTRLLKVTLPLEFARFPLKLTLTHGKKRQHYKDSK